VYRYQPSATLDASSIGSMSDHNLHGRTYPSQTCIHRRHGVTAAASLG